MILVVMAGWSKASMAFWIRLSNTCCTCTASTWTVGRDLSMALTMRIPARAHSGSARVMVSRTTVASLCGRRSISPLPMKPRRVRTISPARSAWITASFIAWVASAEALPVSPASRNLWAALVKAMVASSGWLS